MDSHCIAYAELHKSWQRPVDSRLVCGRCAAVLPSGVAARRDGEVSRCLGSAKLVRSASDLSSKGQPGYASCKLQQLQFIHEILYNNNVLLIHVIHT